MAHNIPGDGSSLPRQYILCRQQVHIPSTWTTKHSDYWYLGHDPALPVGELRDHKAQFIGWLVGYPIDQQGKLSNQFQLAVDSQADDLISQLEMTLSELGGRYIAILISPVANRLYLDPVGTLATVYCPSQQIAASTTSLIPYTQECGDNQPLIDVIQPKQRDGWYPFGLTSRNLVERLIPNHFLDLNTWHSQRHWSPAEIIPTTDCDRSVTEIANILTQQIQAIAHKYPIYLSLTAGRDSRMLLACSQSCLGQIKFFTREIPDQSAKLDCDIASQLASRFGLDHEILPYQTPRETELAQWLVQTGNSVAGRVWRSVRTLKQLQGDRIYLPGIAAEVGRAFYWRKQDSASQAISAVEILDRLQMPQTPLLQERAKQWLSQLSAKDRFEVLDLLYWEQRLGCWAGPLHYGLVNNGFCLSPFVHRRLLVTMLCLPPVYRQNQLLARDLIRRQWAELLSLPFNRYPGLRGRWLVLAKKIKHKIKKLSPIN